MEFYFGEVPGQEVRHIVDIALHIVKQLSKPVVATSHGSFGSNLAENITQMRLQRLNIIDVGLAQRLIGNDCRRSGQAGEVEGLGSRVEGDTVLCKCFVQSGERRVMVTRQNKVAMDFVRNDQHMVFHAYLAQL